MNSYHARSRTVCITILMLSFYFKGLPQTTQNQPQFIPPSPNAYSLGKYGDVPVSLHTGVPDITIPIWTLKEKNLSVDVSLSYHGAGVKVDEIASWVGLGWSLNAGGVITRTIRGRAEYILSDGTFMPERADIDFYSGPATQTSRATFIQQNGLQAAADGGLDTESDVFTFNFQGRSGRFHFNKDGEPRLYKHEALDIKLQYVSSFNYNIIITTEDGIVYEFSDYERTFFPSLGQMHITAWYLSKIKSPTGSEILFEYQPVGAVSHNIRESANYQVYITSNPTIYSPLVPYTGMSVSEIRIKKIITDDGWIEFKPGSQQRLDYKSAAYPLDSVLIFRSDGSVWRKMKLHTSYFEANNIDKYDGLNPELFQHLNYRLRLDGVQEFSGGNVAAKPPYTFSYWGDDNPVTDDAYTLPYRLSPKQDHWGYFNDSSNEHIFPGNSEGRSIYSDAWYQYSMECVDAIVNTTISNGANRLPHAEAVKAGGLKSVHYPTGGYTEYFFETNQWSSTDIGGGLRIGKIVEHTGSGEGKETRYQYGYRGIVADPRDFYYKVYCIDFVQPQNYFNPDPEVLALYGLTVPSMNMDVEVVKISTYPQAILGSGALPGYGSVTVYQPGNGFTTTSFDTHSDYPDYYGIDDFFDDIDMFHVDNLFNSQYINSLSTPLIPYVHQLRTSVSDWPYPELYQNDWKRGLVTARSTYSEDTVLLKRERYFYDRQLLDVVPGFKVKSWFSSQKYIYSKYYVPLAWMQLEKYIVEQYNPVTGNAVVSTTEYYYDNLSHGQQTRSVLTDSNGKKHVTLTTYPLDYLSGIGFIDDMCADHLVSFPVEEVKYQDDNGTQTILSGNITYYKTGGKGLIDRSLQLETEAPLTLGSFRFSNRGTAGVLPPLGTKSSFSPHASYKDRLVFGTYDLLGNLLQYTNSNGVTTSFMWSYNGQYPIVEVKNAQHDQIAYTSFESGETGGWSFSGTPVTSSTSKTGKKYYNLSSGSITKTGIAASENNKYKIMFYARRNTGTGSFPWSFMGQTEFLTTEWKMIERDVATSSMEISFIPISGVSVYIDELRLIPPGAHMNTYTFDPLIGLTSSTDANLQTTYYQYDALGRLECIMDNERNIVKAFSYHFKEN